jgi:hypothetical protein
VPKAEFTYEVRRLPVEASWIEDYVVRTSDGEAVGTVAAVLERGGGERLLVVERGVPPVKPDERAVHWDEIERIDHDALTVWLTVDAEAFQRRALELDPDKAIEEGEGEPEARRITLPPDEIPPAATEPLGPVDRTGWAKAFAAFALMAFTVLLTTIVVFVTGDNSWALLFVVPAILGLVAAALGYRAYRNPYEPRPARKP